MHKLIVPHLSTERTEVIFSFLITKWLVCQPEQGKGQASAGPGCPLLTHHQDGKGNKKYGKNWMV